MLRQIAIWRNSNIWKTMKYGVGPSKGRKIQSERRRDETIMLYGYREEEWRVLYKINAWSPPYQWETQWPQAVHHSWHILSWAVESRNVHSSQIHMLIVLMLLFSWNGMGSAGSLSSRYKYLIVTIDIIHWISTRPHPAHSLAYYSSK